MRAKLQKWGNSLGIRLPKVFAVQMGIQHGSEVEVELRGDSIVVSKPEQTLETLLQTITPEMLHEEIDTGDAVGKEIW